MIDELDRTIIQILQENARIANAEVARRVGLAPSAVFERIRKLEERGVVRGYSALVHPAALELGLLAFVFVRGDDGTPPQETERALAGLGEVQEVHHIAGEDCFLVKVRTRDTHTLGTLLRDRIGAIPSVRGTRTTIVLNTIKETAALPVGGGADATGA